MDVLTKIFAGMALIVAFLGLAAFSLMILEANGAPQQAAAGAMVCAPVIAFYVIARCFEMLGSKDESA